MKKQWNRRGKSVQKIFFARNALYGRSLTKSQLCFQTLFRELSFLKEPSQRRVFKWSRLRSNRSSKLSARISTIALFPLSISSLLSFPFFSRYSYLKRRRSCPCSRFQFSLFSNANRLTTLVNPISLIIFRECQQRS